MHVLLLLAVGVAEFILQLPRFEPGLTQVDTFSWLYDSHIEIVGHCGGEEAPIVSEVLAVGLVNRINVFERADAVKQVAVGHLLIGQI